MSLDARGIGAIFLIAGIIALIVGIFIGMSSVGLASNQQVTTNVALSEGAVRFFLGIAIGIIGIVCIIGGTLMLFRD
jgi:hypothetical protein